MVYKKIRVFSVPPDRLEMATYPEPKDGYKIPDNVKTTVTCLLGAHYPPTENLAWSYEFGSYAAALLESKGIADRHYTIPSQNATRDGNLALLMSRLTFLAFADIRIKCSYVYKFPPKSNRTDVRLEKTITLWIDKAEWGPDSEQTTIATNTVSSRNQTVCQSKGENKTDFVSYPCRGFLDQLEPWFPIEGIPA